MGKRGRGRPPSTVAREAQPEEGLFQIPAAAYFSSVTSLRASEGGKFVFLTRHIGDLVSIGESGEWILSKQLAKKTGTRTDGVASLLYSPRLVRLSVSRIQLLSPYPQSPAVPSALIVPSCQSPKPNTPGFDLSHEL